jgi:malate synthase
LHTAAKGVQATLQAQLPAGVSILADVTSPEYLTILTSEALSFLATLSRKYTERVIELLDSRRERQAEFDSGVTPDFLRETQSIRDNAEWKVNPLPADLQDRRVEITGPTDRKMVINAMNSGANVYLTDFEDANCPTFANMVLGQLNLKDAVERTITYEDPKSGKKYALKSESEGNKLAVLIVRPRGWHLWEQHVCIDGHAVPGAIFDFALNFFHCAKTQLKKNNSGPYYYLPKMESHLECRLWNEIFIDAQDALKIPRGTIKATCLIETLPAAFEMDEFLYELREHSAGLNCGRWDYMFSALKTLRANPTRIFPDRSYLTMDMPFMRAYTSLVIKTCHKRGVHAMGGMSASIPIKNDPAANEAVMEKVRADKLREVTDGHDGTWVAHPGLISIAKEVFNQHMKTPNQITTKPRNEVNVTADQILAVPDGPRTTETLRNNIAVCIRYVAAWLGGTGCVPLYNLMEDAATAEISRAQVWQWVKYSASLDDGKVTCSAALVRAAVDDELQVLREEVGSAQFAAGEYLDASFLTKLMCLGKDLHDFLTLPAQDILIAMGK